MPLDLDTPVQFVRGVGPAIAKLLASLDIISVADLIEYYPSHHETIPVSQSIGTLMQAQTATVIGQVKRVSSRGYGRKITVTCTVEDSGGVCVARWYNSPHMQDRICVGDLVRLTGKVNESGDQAHFANPTFSIIPDDQDPLTDDSERLVPVYAAIARLGSRQIGKIVATALAAVGERIVEFLPDVLTQQRELPARKLAVERLHLPTAQKDVEVARRRLAYEELLLMQLAVQVKRHHAATMQQALPLTLTDEIDERIRARFPFELTHDQNQAVAEITADMARNRPMCRLLQADVGAGKTAIAVYAALVAVANRRQAAILAPTEILAEQHYQKVCRYLEGSRVRIGYVVGGMSKRQRLALLEECAEGSLDLIIGTHALLQENVHFHSLALVVVDEQHRFGVTQRAAIRRKGRVPHYLVLTATPIPRTLAMTVFGDLDVSVIREMPPGRGKVQTRLARTNQSDLAWNFVRSRLAKGERAFVVYPLVEQSESLPLRSAIEAVEELRTGPLADASVGLLHGRLKSDAKQAVMNAFRDGQHNVLVATTVVEVGVDVPEATVMVIQHAERYGLSQLHQLRGRVGRGGKDGYCILISDTKGGDATARLKALVQLNDGFRIAEEDLRIRGPGELIGTRQHGLPTFKVARLLEDIDLLQHARDDAADLVRSDPLLRKPQHQLLRRAVLDRFGETLALIDVA